MNIILLAAIVAGLLLLAAALIVRAGHHARAEQTRLDASFRRELARAQERSER